MKKSILLYLLITAVLLNIFTYMFYSGQVKHEQERFIKYDKKMTDSLTSISNKLGDADYFSLDKNQNAQNYFDNDDPNKYIDYQKLIPLVTNKLLDFNDNPNGNIYTGQEKIGSSKFIINKVKVLNHRWIIADFSDGQNWGEVLLKYFVEDDKSISFEVIQSLIYQKQIVQ
jgi:hypothetical protein